MLVGSAVRRRMGRRGDSIWDHWTIFEQPNPKKMSMDKMKCNYCDTIHCRNTLRSKRHTVKCVGPVPEDVRKQYETEVEEILKEEAEGKRRPYQPKPHRPQARTERIIDDSDDGENATGSRYTTGMEKRKAVELISDLLQLNDSTITPRKKPLSQFTDEDFKREERELSIRKTRAEIKHLELKNELYDRLIHASDRIEPFLNKGNQLMDLMIAEKTGKHAFGPAVEVVYTQHEAHQQTDQPQAANEEVNTVSYS
ncbi:hypothetical protein HDE_06794 [Halotydeus destructor]|nr:hypothetical protein HDE_06794 [Halotydeus destructor]